jgi:hypothetical protein
MNSPSAPQSISAAASAVFLVLSEQIISGTLIEVESPIDCTQSPILGVSNAGVDSPSKNPLHRILPSSLYPSWLGEL